MIVKEKKGLLKWNSANKKRYTDLGYEFTNYKDEFLVDVDDMTKTTRAIVYVSCDYCGEEYETTYKKYNSNRDKSITKKDACKECRSLKIKESNVAKYGQESSNQADEVKNKKEKTYLERYGVKNPSQSEEVKAKVQNTFKLRYGVDNIFKSPAFIKTISGENHYDWHGGVQPLTTFLRNKLASWRSDSLKEYNYSCFITGKTDEILHIHHAYNFSKIFEETIRELNIDIRDSIGKYSREELNLIEDTFKRIHNKYGLGYPMTTDLHKEFHNIYGNKDNSLEQLLEFKEYVLSGRKKELSLS